MKVFTIIKQNLGLLFAPALLVLASCSSYQYSGYEADGIYGESRPGIWEQREQPQKQEVKPNNNNTYYKNLFAQQSEMYGEILEGDIFTDVDSYSSTPHYDNYMQDDQDGDGVAYSGGYAPWGNDPDSYTINIYNNGFYNPWYYGYGYGYGYYGYGYGYPYYRGWYHPYSPYWGGYYSPIAYGYGPYWSIGFNFGYGGYGYPYYGYYNYYNPYWGYHNTYYNRYDHIAYNATRRNEPVRYSEGVSRRNAISDARASSYSRSIREIRNSRTSTYGTSRSRSSNNNGDVNVYTRTNRRVESRPVYNSSRSSDSPTYQTRSRSSNNTYRSSSSRRSSMPARTTTRSSSSTRSSGTTTRSSSGSSRSSRGGRGGR